MPNLVCTGATLQCSFGTTPSTFAATGTRVAAVGSAGVVTDCAAANVPPFGMCMSLSNPQVAEATADAEGVLTPQPCQPVLSDWSPGCGQVTIGGVAALDDSSQCTCDWDGVVTVAAAGQKATSLQLVPRMSGKSRPWSRASFGSRCRPHHLDVFPPANPGRAGVMYENLTR